MDCWTWLGRDLQGRKRRKARRVERTEEGGSQRQTRAQRSTQLTRKWWRVRGGSRVYMSTTRVRLSTRLLHTHSLLLIHLPPPLPAILRPWTTFPTTGAAPYVSRCSFLDFAHISHSATMRLTRIAPTPSTNGLSPKTPSRMACSAHSTSSSALLFSCLTIYRQPIVTGTSVLAIQFKDGIMMAADNLGMFSPRSFVHLVLFVSVSILRLSCALQGHSTTSSCWQLHCHRGLWRHVRLPSHSSPSRRDRDRRIHPR